MSENTIEDPHQLESVKATASALDVCENTVWNLLRRGDLESIKIGSRTLIKRRSRIRLAEHGTTQSAA